MGLAENVRISDDGKTYLFTLREAFWSDGTLVTAKDFERSWKAILTPGFPAPCSSLLYPIKNGELYAKGKCRAEDVGISAVNDFTLQVELEQPTSYFLSLTAFPLFLPSPSHAENDAPLICNGPFILETMKIGEEIVLKKNPTFWNREKILLDQIKIFIIASETTALQLFEKEEIDLVGGPFNPLSIDSLPKPKEELPLHFLPLAASTFCTMNTQTFPFSNQALRKAFALAVINHPMIAKEIAVTSQIKAPSLLPPSLREGFSSLSPPKEQPTKLLDQAMQELGIAKQDLSGLTLYYRTNPLERKIGEILQKIWDEELGIHVHLEQTDPKSLMHRLYARNYQISLASWIAQFHDPINILDRFKDEKNQKNYPGWSHPEYKKRLDESAKTQDASSRLNILAEAEKILEEETVCIPLYHWSSPLLIHPKVKGLTTTNSGGILIEHVSIEPESFSQHH